MNGKLTSSILYVDRERLLEILKSIYTLTKVKITIYDARHQIILAYPAENSCFCQLVRSRELSRCFASDEYGFSLCENSNHFVSYNCHAGLIEVVAPLKQNDETIGYIMFGQMLPDEDVAACIHKLQSRFDYLVEDRRTLCEAISRLPVRNDEEIHAAIQLMEVCISYLLSNRILFTEKGQLVERLNDYIDAHLSEEITPELLCSYFGMRRTTFYTVSQKALGCGVMSYIRRRRIEAAKAMLKTQNLPIAEIASRVGFNDYNYFLRVFKKQVGMSCNAYRRALIREHSEHND